MEIEPPQFLFAALIFGTALLLSAFFSAAEVAFVALSPAKTRTLLEIEKSRAANLIAGLKSSSQRFLVTILIGSNLVNTFAAGYATVIATRFFGDAGLGIATGVVTFAMLIFGEVLPKSFAQKHAAATMLLFAYPLWLLDRLLFPLTYLAEKILPRDAAVAVTEAELLATIDLGTESGELKEHERELIQNVLEFTDTRVGEVMVPRVEIEALEKSKTVAEASEFFQTHSHSRLPVFDEKIDSVIGFVSLRDVFEARGTPQKKLHELDLSQPIFTPISRPIRSLFLEFKSRRVHLAIVVDEHGGTAGLVTLEDLLEELVGEIQDEEDVAEEGLKRIHKTAVRAPGDTPLWDIDGELATTLATGEFESKNVAYLMLDRLGRLARAGDKIRVENVELTVEEVAGKRIKTVKIERI